jgi:hypothetical protein
MAKYRDRLPQVGGRLFLTDGGIETTLIFHEGCGTDHRHIERIAEACVPLFRMAT